MATQRMEHLLSTLAGSSPNGIANNPTAGASVGAALASTSQGVGRSMGLERIYWWVGWAEARVS